MSDRITNNMLSAKVEYINKRLNRPVAGWQKDDKDQWSSLVGHIMIDHYSPGDNPYQWKLTEYANDCGGQNDWTNYRMTRKEFYAYLVGIIDGLERK